MGARPKLGLRHRVDGGFLIVIGLLAGLSVAMFFFVWAFPWFIEPDQYTAPNQPYSADNGQGGQEGREDHFWVGPFHGVVYGEDTAAQWFMAAFAGFATIASVYAVWLLRETLRYTRSTLRQAGSTNRAAWETVRETKRIGEAQVRAYLSYRPGNVQIDTFRSPVFGPRIRFAFDGTIYNTGQTPARHVQSEFDIMQVHWPREGRINYTPEQPINDAKEGVRSIGGQDGGPCTFEKTIEVDNDALQRGAVRIMLVGNIIYEDVFGEEWHSEFCLTIRELGGFIRSYNSRRGQFVIPPNLRMEWYVHNNRST